jgi:hypothetical protein
VSDVKEQTPIQEFQQKLYELHDKQRLIARWHKAIYEHTDGAVELPWNPVDTWIFSTVGKYEHVPKPTEADPDATNYEYVTDIEASLAKLSSIAKFASKCSLVQGIEKKYRDNSFELKIKLDDDTTVDYTVKREVVCNKVVKGMKVVPATPEREVEDVEWECKPVSLIGFDATEYTA